jgi:radical SAM protein with 4Fe4S-binding SPASM domain
VTYVGISLDGKPEVHDEFRQKKGAYAGAIEGIRNCRQLDLKVGLRLTLTRHTRDSLDWLFDVIDEQGIERVCFYHLVYSGRGRAIEGTDLSHEESRETLDLIIKKSGERMKRGQKIEVLTVDQSCDGPYLALKMFEEGREERAHDLMKMLAQNGGGAAGSGVGICNIDPKGGVHPDQFWQADLGNIRNKPFSQIWTDGQNELLANLRNRLNLLKGRCGTCAFKKECGGSFRARAVAVHNDPWMEDPACYLSEDEIKNGIKAGIKIG